MSTFASELTPGFQVQLFLLFEVRVFSGMAATPPVGRVCPSLVDGDLPHGLVTRGGVESRGYGCGPPTAGVDVACTQPHDARLDCVNERPDTDKGKVMPPGRTSIECRSTFNTVGSMTAKAYKTQSDDALLSWRQTFNAFGQATAVTGNCSLGQRVQAFTYDNAARLVGSKDTCSSVATTRDYDFDVTSNRTKLVEKQRFSDDNMVEHVRLGIAAVVDDCDR